MHPVSLYSAGVMQQNINCQYWYCLQQAKRQLLSNPNRMGNCRLRDLQQM